MRAKQAYNTVDGMQVGNMFQRQVVGGRQGLQVSAALGTKQLKKVAPKKKNIPLPPGANKRGLAKGQQPEDALWLPNTERPAWLTGTFLCYYFSIFLVIKYTLAHVPAFSPSTRKEIIVSGSVVSVSQT